MTLSKSQKPLFLKKPNLQPSIIPKTFLESLTYYFIQETYLGYRTFELRNKVCKLMNVLCHSRLSPCHSLSPWYSKWGHIYKNFHFTSLCSVRIQKKWVFNRSHISRSVCICLFVQRWDRPLWPRRFWFWATWLGQVVYFSIIYWNWNHQIIYWIIT